MLISHTGRVGNSGLQTLLSVLGAADDVRMAAANSTPREWTARASLPVDTFATVERSRLGPPAGSAAGRYGCSAGPSRPNRPPHGPRGSSAPAAVLCDQLLQLGV